MSEEDAVTGMELLGHRVTDKITRFSGVVTGYVVYITGCNQYLVAPAVGADGAFRESAWIDEQRLEVDQRQARIVLGDPASTVGSDRAPSRESPPVR